MVAPVAICEDRSVNFNSIAVQTCLNIRNVMNQLLTRTSCKGKQSSVEFSECSHNSLVSGHVFLHPEVQVDIKRLFQEAGVKCYLSAPMCMCVNF